MSLYFLIYIYIVFDTVAFVSGLNPCRLSGKNIGVYMGSIYSESEDRTCIEIKFKYGMLGHSRAMLSNRISYWLNLIGELMILPIKI